MQFHENIQQGSQEWHALRAGYFTASEAPAMMGMSPYKTRTQLLDEKKTGIIPEVDAATQRRFDQGHEAEAAARAIAEKIIGEDLFPVVGTEGNLLASFDGLSIDGGIVWEHKLWNAKLAEAIKAGNIADHYRAQIEQQLMLAEADKCLFMASDGTEENCVWCWVESDPAMRTRLLQGWTQFAIDLETHQPTIAKPAPKAEAIEALPAVFVQATGMVTASNLSEFRDAATSFIANIKTELATDQDFADADETVKFCKQAEANIEQVKQSITAQMSSVDEVLRTLDHISAQLRDKRLMLDKLVKTEKESRKAAIVQTARMRFNDFVLELEKEIKPIRLTMPMPVFADAIKGLKNLSAMQESVDTMLRDSKFTAEQVAKDVRAKLAWCKTNAASHSALFPDLQQIITKPFDDFTLTITSRIEKAKADEAARMEAERARIQAEEEAKARAKIEAEERARVAAEVKAQLEARIPTKVQMIELIALHYGVAESTALDWIIAEFAGDIEFNKRKAA